MPFETVELRVGGRVLRHTDCALTAGAEKAVREATFTVPPTGAGLPCGPDEEATVTVSGTLWGTGFIRDVRGSHDDRTRSYDLAFVSRTIDATECSVEHRTGFLADCDLMQVAREFDTLGIGVEGDVKTERKPRHKVVPGETLFATIETDARAQGILIHDTEHGRLKLADKPEGRHAGALKLGVNILRASGQLTGEGRFSPVIVRGQSSAGTAASSLRPEAAKAENGLPRRRPRIVPFEGEATSARLKRRAAWEARRGMGNGTGCTITVPGWRDAAGRLWTRNFLVAVADAWLGIEGDMVISDARLEQGADGTVATLTCKDPRALGGEDPRGKSAGGWSAPGAAEAEYEVED